MDYKERPVIIIVRKTKINGPVRAAERKVYIWDTEAGEIMISGNIPEERAEGSEGTARWIFPDTEMSGTCTRKEAFAGTWIPWAS